MSSMYLSLPLKGGKARAIIFNTDTGFALSLADGGGNRIGKAVHLNTAQVRALRECLPKWRDTMIWSVLGKDIFSRTNGRPVATAYCHPGTGRVA